MTVDFTVVIPTYNRGDLIAETLDAVLAQTRPAREVIVVDDGSTDDTPAVLSRYRNRIVVRRVQNSGAQAARNEGIRLANSRWIALCDSDDIWYPDYLEKQARLLDSEPEAQMSFGNFRILQDGSVGQKTKFDDAPAGYWERYTAKNTAHGRVMTADFAGSSFLFHPLFPSAMVFTKELALSVGGFSPAMPKNAEDGEFTLRCLYKAKVAALSEPLVLIRKHSGNISGDGAARMMAEVRVLRYIKENHREAAPYRATIEDQIRIRTIMGFDAAFAAKLHPEVREIYGEIPESRRTRKMKLKFLVASCPDLIGLPLNSLLQRLTRLPSGAVLGKRQSS